MVRRSLFLVLMVLALGVFLSPDLAAQRRGGGGRPGGGARPGGNGGTNPTGPGRGAPVRPGTTPVGGDNEEGGSVPAPERDDRVQIRWVVCPATEALPTEGNADPETLLTRILDSKSTPGTPTVIFIHDGSNTSDDLERTVFKDERVAIASLFYTYVRLSARPPLSLETVRQLTGGKGAAIVLFDGDKKESKRFQGPTAVPTFFQALAPPVRKAVNVNLQVYVDQELKFQAELDKTFANFDKLQTEMDNLSANGGNGSSKRRMEDLTKQMTDLAAQIKAIQEKERAHVAAAMKRS